MIYKRHILKHLLKISRQFKSLLLVGPRQVGKSTIVKDNFLEYKYFTFDDELLRSNTIDNPGLFFVDNKPPIILDEVQYISNLFNYIKIECDKNDIPEYGKFILTGSQSFRLMNNVSESLAGRVAIKSLLGLSRREILKENFDLPFIPNEKYINKRKNEYINKNNIWDLIYKGSFPELYKKETDWATFYSSYLQTYIERDINELINIKDKTLFINFLTALAARTGQILNLSNLSEEAGVTVATIKSWISILECTNLIYLLKPYSNNVLKRIIKSPKIYFSDTGIVCYLTKNTNIDIVKNGPYSGALYETLIMNEIIKSFLNYGLDPFLYLFYYRGKDSYKNNDNEFIKENEIDLVIDYDNIIYPIEIKKTANPNLKMISSYKVLTKIPYKKIATPIIISSYDKYLKLDENVISIPYTYI